MPTPRGVRRRSVASDPASSPATCTRTSPSSSDLQRRQADDAPAFSSSRSPQRRCSPPSGRGLARAGSGRVELAGEHAHRDRPRARGERGARGHHRSRRDPGRDADAGPGRDRHAGAHRRRRRPRPPRPTQTATASPAPEATGPPRRGRLARAGRRPVEGHHAQVADQEVQHRDKVVKVKMLDLDFRSRVQVERPIVTISTTSQIEAPKLTTSTAPPPRRTRATRSRPSGPGADRRAELLHRQVPDSSLPAPDLPGRRHAVRHALGGPRRRSTRSRPTTAATSTSPPPARWAGCSSCPPRGRCTASTPTRTATRTPSTRSTRSSPPRATCAPPAPTRTCAGRSSPTTTPIGTSTPC